jgi:hypothetical protein
MLVAEAETTHEPALMMVTTPVDELTEQAVLLVEYEIVPLVAVAVTVRVWPLSP